MLTKSGLNFFAFICCLCFLLKNELSAQVPGYRGHKIHFNVGVNLNPLINSFGIGKDDTFDFNPQIKFEPNFCLSKSTALLFSYEWQKDKIKLDKDYYGIDAENTRLKNQAVYIGLKLFDFAGKGAIAPVGNYFLLKFGFRWYDVENPSIEDGNTNLPVNFSRKQITTGFGFGKQSVLFEKLIIDRGIYFGFPIKDLRRFRNKEKEDDITNHYNDAGFVTTRKIFLQEMLSVFISIGFLP